jgi:hypothetical protein
MNATVTNNTVNGHSLNTAVSFVGGISVTGFEEVTDLQLTANSVTGTPANRRSAVVRLASTTTSRRRAEPSGSRRSRTRRRRLLAPPMSMPPMTPGR